MNLGTAVVGVGCLGLVVLAFYARPEPLTYLFVGVSLMFPKFLNFTLGGEEIQTVRALELAVAGALVVSMIRHVPVEKVRLSREARVVLGIGLVLAFVFAVRALLGWGEPTGGESRSPAHLPGAELPAGSTSHVPVPVAPDRQLFALVLPVYGLLFFYLGLRHFRTPEKLKGLFRVLIACAVVGSLEGLIVPRLGIAPALEDPGNLRVIQAGLTLGGRDMVTHTVLLAIVAVMYFLDLPRSDKAFVLLLPVFGIAVVASLSVPAWVGVALATVAYMYLRQGARGKNAAIDLALVLSSLALALGFLVGVAGVLGASLDEDAFSLQYRIGLWSFVVDWIVWSFPFGLGAGAVPLYFEESSIARFSSAHNLLLEFIAEFGLIGMIGLIACGWLLARNFLAWRRAVAGDGRQDDHALLGAAIYSMLIGTLVLMQVDSTIRLYSVYMLLLASTEVLSRAPVPAVAPRRTPTQRVGLGRGGQRRPHPVDVG